MPRSRIIVHVSDAKVSNNPDDIIITYSLGSCIGVCLYDSSVKTGGMLHYQLPESKMDAEKAKQKPFMFADTGLQLLIDKLVSMGVNKKRMRVKVAGGATMDTGPKGFDIGKRNYLALRKIIWKQGIFIDSEDIGGSSPRNLYLDISDGNVMIKSNGSEKAL